MEGVDLSDAGSRSFIRHGREFFIAALVQYQLRSAHFVCHLRHPIGSYLLLLL